MGLFDRFAKSKNKEVRDARPAADVPPVSAPDATNSETVASETVVPEIAASQTAPSETSGGLLSRLRKGLKRTADLLQTDIRDLFKQEGQLVDDELLGRLYALLVRTDMGAAAAAEIRDEIRQAFRGRVVQLDEVLAHVKQKLLEMMQQDEAPLHMAPSGPTVILVVGVNGSGKTTSIAKLARLLTKHGKKVVLGAGDTFRAAAVEQLTVWADRIGADIVKGAPGSDPASVAHRAVARALETNADICIIDTAGRLQTQSNLMDQLAKIRRVIQKQIPDGPHEVLLVLDATAGQNGLSQARGFSQAVDCTGIVLAKLDGTAKGGVVIPIRREFEIPVKFIGIGEGPDDLAPFDPQAFVDALFADVNAPRESQA